MRSGYVAAKNAAMVPPSETPAMTARSTFSARMTATRSWTGASSDGGGRRGAIHAYALLPTQVLLLVTPSQSTSLSRLWQASGRRFGADYNRRHRRIGVLWEGRFRTTVVDADAHLLDCCRHVEWAPVRAGPGRHAVRLRLVERRPSPRDPSRRRDQRTPALLGAGQHPLRARSRLSAPARAAIARGGRTTADRCGDEELRAVGDAAFVRSLGELTDRRVVPLPRGRPRGLVSKRLSPNSVRSEEKLH